MGNYKRLVSALRSVAVTLLHMKVTASVVLLDRYVNFDYMVVCLTRKVQTSLDGRKMLSFPLQTVKVSPSSREQAEIRPLLSCTLTSARNE
jgi:hypothetical protein